MKRFCYLVLTSVFYLNGLLGQSCLPNGIVFMTQQELNDFATNYQGCTVVSGDVIIIGGALSLSGLNQITSIEGSLSIINNSSLSSLAGLENLTSVGERLDIDNNDALLDLESLNSLMFVGGEVGVSGNNILTSLKGLDNLTAVGGLKVTANASLSNLAGLENVTSIVGGLLIGGNSSLGSLTGLESLTSIIGGLWVLDNAALPDLTGLENLTSMSGELRINNNPALISLAGLENLVSIGLDVRIYDNPILGSLTSLQNATSGARFLVITDNGSLSSLTGLENIDANGIDYLRIYGNPNLSVCGLPNICYFLNNGGDYSVYNNALNCNTDIEILASCSTVSVSDLEVLPIISISPNPNAGRFETSGIMEGDYTIFNIAGQLVQQGQLTGNTSIDISNAPQGIYMMSIILDNEIITERIVKM